jgi:peptidoglycan/LPS O-acetylase OafA/YrhL
MRSEGETRLAGADFIRASACLLVLLHHLILRLDVSKAPPGLRTAFDIGRFGSFGVALFFVLSGFLLARPFWTALDRGGPMPSLRVFALRRAARILPGFWVALVSGFILSFAVYDFELDGELFGRFAAGFLLMSQWHWRTFFPVQGDGPLWSIPFEATAYVLLPLAFAPIFLIRERLKGPLKQRLAWLGIVCLALFVHWLIVRFIPMDNVGRGWNFGFQGGAKEWMPRFNPIGFFAIFAIGAGAAGIHARLPSRPMWICDFIGLVALTCAAAQLPEALGGAWEGYGWFGIPYRFPYLPVFVAVALCTLPQSVLLGRLLDNAASRFVATISFGIYIWQDIVISLIKTSFPASFGAEGSALLGWTTSSLIAILLIFAIATVSFVFLERPVMRWARNLEGNGKLMPAAS